MTFKLLWCGMVLCLAVGYCSCIVHRTTPVLTGVHPIVYQGSLLGGIIDSKIVNAETMVQHLSGGERYQCYTQKSFVVASFVGKPDLERNDGAPFNYDIAVCGSWNLLPHVPKVIRKPLSSDYQAVRTYLATRHIYHAPVHILSVHSADINNDGNIERVICAISNPNYLDGSKGVLHLHKGDYSMVLVSQSQKKTPHQILIVGEFYTHIVDDMVGVKFSTGGIYDLDGDGQMEFIVDHISSDEMFGSTVYKIQNNKSKETALQYYTGP